MSLSLVDSIALAPPSSSRASLALACLLLSSTNVSCTLFAGQPWGEAELDLAAAFAPPDARLTENGQLKTSRDYALSLSELIVTFDAVALSVSDESGDVSFDPAAPPSGYSLCHNGHCHSDDGRLVDYAEIERSLGGAGGGSTLAVPVRDGVVELQQDPAALTLEPCEGGCVLGRGILSSLSIAMSAVEIRATVTDLRPDEDARLPPEGAQLSARVLGSALAAAALDVPLDGSEDPGLTLTGVLQISPALFDGVDFGALAADDDGTLALDDEAEAAVLEELAESELSLEVTRAPLERPFTPILYAVDDDGRSAP